jgi:hypothetical protein
MLPPCIVKLANGKYGVVVDGRRIGTHYASIRDAIRARDAHIKEQYKDKNTSELRAIVFGAANETTKWEAVPVTGKEKAE